MPASTPAAVSSAPWTASTTNTGASSSSTGSRTRTHATPPHRPARRRTTCTRWPTASRGRCASAWRTIVILQLRAMSDVEQVLREYIREHRAGGAADPRGYLARLDDRSDRLELEALIDAYLEHAPRDRVSIPVVPSPATEQLVDRIEVALDAAPETWRTFLPTLRMRARLKRGELVARLTEALGLAGREHKVARYYNAMEHEQLDPSRIPPRVFEALAGIVETTAEALRRAAPGGAAPRVASAPTFARAAP